MRFKLGKSSFSIGFSALVLGFLSIPYASAMTVTLASTGNGQQGGSSALSTFFFPAAGGSTPYSYGPALNIGQDAAANGPIIVFNVLSSQVTASPTPSPSSGATQQYLLVTIAGPTLTLPVTLNSINPGYVTSQSGNAPVYAGVMTGGNVQYQVSLNVKTICENYATVAGATANGCASALLGGAGPPNTFANLQLIFGIYNLTAVPANNVAPTGAVDTATVNLDFSNAGPTADTMTCNLSAAYYPADGGITVDGSQFGGITATTEAGSTDALSQLLVVGELNGPYPNGGASDITAATVQSTPSTYQIISQVGLVPGQVVPGFQNSTQASDGTVSYNNYEVGFVGVDDYGFLTDNPTVCTFPHYVETAAIQGFLQGSKCFIASAAFRSDSLPLKLLRRFRDDFLERFSAGTTFVRWYYSWSPRAADWLIENPEFRFPVLLALIPLQMMAWAILHPLVLLLLLTAGISLLGYAALFRYRNQVEFRG